MDISSSSFQFAKELIQHNLVVFRGGEGALQVLPPLIDVISEARLNLVIYYFRQGMSIRRSLLSLADIVRLAYQVCY